MKWTDFLLAGLLVVAGILAYNGMTFEEGQTAPSSFQDVYPGESEWTDHGSLTNLDSTDGLLSVDGTGTGTFESYDVDKGEIISFESVVVDSNVDGNSQGTLNITAYGEDNSTIDSRSIQLEDGVNRYQLDLLGNDTATKYDFSLSLENNAEVSEVSIEGVTEIAEGFDQTLGLLILVMFVLAAVFTLT